MEALKLEEKIGPSRSFFFIRRKLKNNERRNRIARLALYLYEANLTVSGYYDFAPKLDSIRGLLRAN